MKAIKYLSILLIVAVVVAIFYASKKTGKTIPSISDIGGVIQGPGGSQNPEPENRVSFPIDFGTRGFEVFMIQKYLNNTQQANLTQDSIYGPKTNAAWVEFLKQSGDYTDFELEGVKAVYEYQYDDYIKDNEEQIMNW